MREGITFIGISVFVGVFYDSFFEAINGTLLTIMFTGVWLLLIPRRILAALIDKMLRRLGVAVE